MSVLSSAINRCDSTIATGDAQTGAIKGHSDGIRRGGQPWPVTRGDTKGYARELKDLVGKLGPDHVALGTDIEGVGANWSVNDYGHVRSVVDHLQTMKLDSSIIERVAYRNYARVLKAALEPA